MSLSTANGSESAYSIITMDFAWAVTDTTKIPPEKTDTFRGYFTDIQRAARRSLPKKPDKDLCQLLGLSLVPAGNETERAKEINEQIQESTKDPNGVKETVEETGINESGLKGNKQVSRRSELNPFYTYKRIFALLQNTTFESVAAKGRTAH